MNPTTDPAQVDQNLELTPLQQAQMVQALHRTLCQAEDQEATLIETHISYVLVCGGQAWKIKKALRNSFLDQSKLALRLHACDEELRLNRRLAAALYLGVVAVTGSPAAPQLGGSGRVIDCAVQMRAFAQDDLWDRLAARGALRAADIDQLAAVLAPFHASAAVADAKGPFGLPAQVRAPLLESLDELEALVQTAAQHQSLGRLRAWEDRAFARLAPGMATRLAQGRVRECHGDLHLGNVTMIGGQATVFDGIEFNEGFRWIDVMSDIAFMAMDLLAHGLPRLAHRFVNAYLELSDDYAGAPVLGYYLVHRALVRAKVELMRLQQCQVATQSLQTDASEAQRHAAAAARYLDLAVQFGSQAEPVLMLTHGFSGSGKTTLTQGLLEATGAVRIRADVQRKRLAGMQPLQHSGSGLNAGLYNPDMTAATYARLLDLAGPVLAAGRHVILDATFLRREQRDAARAWARARGRPCLILDFDAKPELLRQRLRERAARGDDASEADEAVLAAQMQSAQPVQADEEGAVHRCRPGDHAGQVDWQPLLERLAAVVGATVPACAAQSSRAAP